MKKCISILLAITILLGTISGTPLNLEVSAASPRSQSESFSGNFAEFMEQKAYNTFWYSEWETPSQYAFLDIDQNGSEELIISSEPSMGWRVFQVFQYNSQTKQILPLQISYEPSGVLSVSASCFHELLYSEQKASIAFSSLNNGSAFGGLGYYSIHEDTLTIDFSIGWERNLNDTENPGQNVQYRTSDEDNISEEKYKQYLNELIPVEFSPISEYVNAPSVENESQYASGPSYQDIVQKAMNYTQSISSWSTGYGALYDVDGNGIDELLMVYYAQADNKPAYVYSVYTISGGTAVPLLEEEVLFIDAGGPNGYIGIVENGGKTYFYSTSETGETGGPGIIHRYGSWTLFSIDGASITPDTAAEYDVYKSSGTVEYDRSSAVIDGKTCSYKEYEDWKNSFHEILSINAYQNESIMTLEELLEYLKENPVEIRPEASEVDKTDDSAEPKDGLIIYSDYSNLSIRKGSTITLSAGILADGALTEDISGITFQIDDTSILGVFTTDNEDNCMYVKLKGLAEGTTTVVFSDSNTGYTTTVPITVYDNNYLSYTLNSVPTQNIEKYPTNIYNANGLYIDNYSYKVNDDQSATVSFDVYNTNYTYGVVEILDEDGNVKNAVLIDKMTSSNTSIKEALWDNIGYLVRDFFQGDFLTYRQESGFSKKTSISVEVPKNGYIKISTDPENSSIVGLVNYADLLLSTLALTGEITEFDVNSKEFSEKLTAKMLNEEIFAELVRDSEKTSQTLWKNISKEALITSETMGDFVDTAIKSLSEFGLIDVIMETASECGWNLGENVFTDLAGPFGDALDLMFTGGKAENILIQYHDLTQSAGVGSIYIQNQGGGFRSCQQIKVESKKGFSADTALNVFTVTLDSTLLDMIKEANPDIHEAMTSGITHTYNISLWKNGAETQPDGKVTVYIPIPEDMRLLAHANKAKIYRIEEDGTLTEMDTKIENGCFVFKTNHFSLYTLMGSDTIEQSSFGIVQIALVSCGISFIAIIALVLFIFIHKKSSAK